MLLYLFFDSLMSTCPKKRETEKWPKAADSPLLRDMDIVESTDTCNFELIGPVTKIPSSHRLKIVECLWYTNDTRGYICNGISLFEIRNCSIISMGYTAWYNCKPLLSNLL